MRNLYLASQPHLRPLVAAYLLGLLSTTAPRFARTLLLLFTQKLRLGTACLQIWKCFNQATAYYRFPTFCATLIGGSTLLQHPLRAVAAQVSGTLRCPADRAAITRLARFSAALLAASGSFVLLNSAPPSPRYETLTPLVKPAALGPFDEPPEDHLVEAARPTTDLSDQASSHHLPLAGRTLDLTLFTAVRALDVALLATVSRLPSSIQSKHRSVIRNASLPLFWFSAASIMHAWFYSPSRLPQSYNKWITAAAQLDHRLLLALRHARYGTWVYGKDTGMASLLGSMCEDYGLEPTLGDPASTVPIPCEVVHMGAGRSCEKHAMIRFWRGFSFAARIYAPLNLLMLARNYRRTLRLRSGAPTRADLARPILQACSDLARNSSFLGAFIALFYYGVCLSRTRLGPKLFSYKTVTPQMWDSGLCVLGGCLLCGLSILVQEARKRLEIVFFVLPRAAATWLPRRYLPENRWKEHLAFALSAAVVLTAVQEDKRKVRGVFGQLLARVMGPG